METGARDTTFQQPTTLLRLYTFPSSLVFYLVLSLVASQTFLVRGFNLLQGGRDSIDSMNSPETTFRLGYVTDVEGNLEYFHKFVQASSVLTWKGAKETTAGTEGSPPPLTAKDFHLDLCGDHCYFVYGGDAVDKGLGDIRMVRCLVDLKRRYPERVFLLVGNRDLNKLRYSAELSDEDMARPVSDIPPPHWDLKAPTLKAFLESKDLMDSKVNRMHYMLQHTLGCPQTFEFRRQELAILRAVHPSEVSDEEVVSNFLYEVENKNGSLHQYLQVADVAVCIGNTLFCHGAVDAATMKFIPSIETRFENPESKPEPAAMIDNVQEWTHSLNSFLRQGTEDYTQRPYWNKDRTSRGGEALMALQNRPAMWGRSIISNCYGDGGCITTDAAASIREDKHRLEMAKTNPLAFESVSSDPMDPVVAEWLLKDGIQRVVVGHKPTGDCPAVLSSKYTGVEIVSADTSFSDTRSRDNRGKALAVVEIVGESSLDNQLETSGCLQNGTLYATKHARLHPAGVDFSGANPNVGTRLETEEWWVKVELDEHFYLTRGSGRKVEYKTVPKEELSTALTPRLTYR